MGDREVIKNLLDEFICSICLQYFRHAVTTDCGHSFCQICLKRWKKISTHFSCPECREVLQLREYKPTVSLLHQVDIIRLSESYLLQNTEGQLTCQRHQKAQKLFCFDDETPICVSCSESQEHEGHVFLPIMEAVEHYKRQYWDHQDNLWELLECLQETLSKEMERPLSWSVVWTSAEGQVKCERSQSNQESPIAMLKACIPAIFKSPREDPEEEQEMEELLELMTEESESESELQESDLGLESEPQSEEDEAVENGLLILNEQEMEMFQQLKKREAMEISKMFKQRKEWKAKMELQIRDIQEVLTELEQKCRRHDEELLQGVTDRLRRSEALLLQGWAPFSPKLSHFYLIMATLFLLKFQESLQVKNWQSYGFYEDKKRYVTFIPDASGEMHAIYTIFDSKESQKTISQNLIYFNIEDERVYEFLQKLSS